MNTELTQQQIDDAIVELMKSDPVKFVGYCLIVIGRDILESGAEEFTFSQEADLAECKRFKISVKGTIKEIKAKK